VEQQHEERVKEILSSYESGPGKLVPILLDVQSSIGYLPEEGMQQVARFLNINVGQIYSVASFYSQFQLTPVGRLRVTVCRGTACHIRGAPQILEELENEIGIKEGETSSDMEYTLETVACIGCCALAPCIKINTDVHGELTPRKVNEVLHNLDKGETDGG
jgi:NADH-quinone oxidoreductase subunit E